MARGLADAWPSVTLDICPLADGGEGTLDALVAATGGSCIPVQVTGPLGEARESPLGILGDGRTAVVEIALTSGLALIPPERHNPLSTTTRGAGELIAAALDLGYREFIIGIGGSGTCDGGTGLASALGLRLLDIRGRELAPGGGPLTELASLDTTGLDPRLAEASFLVAADVDNPLCGPDGAARIYAPQKGASPEAVEVLEQGLCRLSEIVRLETGSDLATQPGTGAAGGLGFGLMVWLGAELQSGAELIMRAAGFSKHLAGCRLVITGEGHLDEQTARGKTVLAVARAAASQGVPVIALAGEVAGGLEELHAQGLTAALSIAPGPQSLPEALAGAGLQLESACHELGRLLAICLASVNR